MANFDIQHNRPVELFSLRLGDRPEEVVIRLPQPFDRPVTVELATDRAACRYSAIRGAPGIELPAGSALRIDFVPFMTEARLSVWSSEPFNNLRGRVI